MKRVTRFFGSVLILALVGGAMSSFVGNALASENSHQIKETIKAAINTMVLTDARVREFTNPLRLERVGKILTLLQKRQMNYQPKEVVSLFKNTLAILAKTSFSQPLIGVNKIQKLRMALGSAGLNSVPLTPVKRGTLQMNAKQLHAPFQWEPTFTTSDTKLYSIFTAFDLGPKLFNYPPNSPSNPNPANGASDIGVNVTLSWTCTDPDQDVLHYDIYFGNANPPSLVASDSYDTTYTVADALSFNTQYWWQIIAKDQVSQTPGALWSFTTIQGDTTPPTSFVTDPTNGSYINTATYVIKGTATDEAGGSGIQLVEVSVDGGVTWRPATGTDSWTYEWTVGADGVYTIISKAKDNAGNEETPNAGVSITLDRTRPMIYAAGYWDTEITTNYGGPFTLVAAVLDDDIESVQIYIGGQPTNPPAYLVDDGTQGDWVAGDQLYTLAISDVGPGVPPGQFLAELAATDHAGNVSMIWPYLEIYPSDTMRPPAHKSVTEVKKLAALKSNLVNYLNFISRGPMRPRVMVGGYWDTFISAASGGNLTMLMYASDPDGDSDVINVELFYGGASTGVYLSDDGPPVDWTANDNIFMLVSPISAGLPADQYLVEGVAHDQSGNSSHMYPYLTVEP